jgi:sugar/nucleoside kinase (ribokinase family)
MNSTLDVYLYGMTLLSTIHQLDGLYPPADTYREIKRSHILPGGETGNAAFLLSHLGLKVKSDGPFLGTQTRKHILLFNRKFGIDSSGMRYDRTFPGWQDLILVDEKHRTAFGWFNQRFRPGGGSHWAPPDKTAIQKARVASIDPFFKQESQKAARLCHEAGKPYVTLDCPPESLCHRHSAINVVSREYINGRFTGVNVRRLIRRYTEASRGLVVFTFGAGKILYARRGGIIRSFTPFRVKVAGTLGAGDSFRAGLVYGLFKNWDDTKCVRFAAALAACFCLRFPAALNPPSLPMVLKLMGAK